MAKGTFVGVVIWENVTRMSDGSVPFDRHPMVKVTTGHATYAAAHDAARELAASRMHEGAEHLSDADDRVSVRTAAESLRTQAWGWAEYSHSGNQFRVRLSVTDPSRYDG